MLDTSCSDNGFVTDFYIINKLVFLTTYNQVGKVYISCDNAAHHCDELSTAATTPDLKVEIYVTSAAVLNKRCPFSILWLMVWCSQKFCLGANSRNKPYQQRKSVIAEMIRLYINPFAVMTLPQLPLYGAEVFMDMTAEATVTSYLRLPKKISERFTKYPLRAYVNVVFQTVSFKT